MDLCQQSNQTEPLIRDIGSKTCSMSHGNGKALLEILGPWRFGSWHSWAILRLRKLA